MRDLHNNLTPVAAFAPAAKTATANGLDVDLQGYEAAELEIVVGTITDGTHTPKLQEAPDNGSGAAGTYTDVAAIDQLGTLAALATGVNQRVGYRGKNRWIRVVFTVSGATTGGVYGALVERGHKRHKVGDAV